PRRRLGPSGAGQRAGGHPDDERPHHGARAALVDGYAGRLELVLTLETTDLLRHGRVMPAPGIRQTPRHRPCDVVLGGHHLPTPAPASRPRRGVSGFEPDV
ncbi:hypothetical protein H7I76_11675, partial [Mycolicibacterium vaccae]|nr:hypothetical protein [Mycolicibacterium vaccae]